MDTERLKAFLEGMYYVYARRELVYPDPLYFLYRYNDIRDREIVALIVSSLAYGRVSQIMKSCEKVLAFIGDKPYEFLMKYDATAQVLPNFKHRFTTSSDISSLLLNISSVLHSFGSLQSLLSLSLSHSLSLFHALHSFSSLLNPSSSSFPLVPSPLNGSPCKRLFLFLRWLTRSDHIDTGGWSVLSPDQLIIPLDTHMFRISRLLGLTSASSHSLHSAITITRAFSSINPTDPVKYDFSLSRLGIRGLEYTYFITNTSYSQQPHARISK